MLRATVDSTATVVDSDTGISEVPSVNLIVVTTVDISKLSIVDSMGSDGRTIKKFPITVKEKVGQNVNI